MQRLRTAVIAVFLVLSATHSAHAITCSEIRDGRLVGSDGQFLGEIVEALYPTSVFNRFGVYGSKVHETSIWNDFSLYGATYSDLSAFALFASAPPRILDRDGKEVGRLTTNKAFRLRMSPSQLRSCS